MGGGEDEDEIKAVETHEQHEDQSSESKIEEKTIPSSPPPIATTSTTTSTTQRKEKPVLTSTAIGAILGFVGGALFGSPTSGALVGGALGATISAKNEEVGRNAQLVSKKAMEVIDTNVLQTETGRTMQNGVSTIFHQVETYNNQYKVTDTLKQGFGELGKKIEESSVTKKIIDATPAVLQHPIVQKTDAKLEELGVKTVVTRTIQKIKEEL